MEDLFSTSFSDDVFSETKSREKRAARASAVEFEPRMKDPLSFFAFSTKSDDEPAKTQFRNEQDKYKYERDQENQLRSQIDYYFFICNYDKCLDCCKFLIEEKRKNFLEARKYLLLLKEHTNWKKSPQFWVMLAEVELELPLLAECIESCENALLVSHSAWKAWSTLGTALSRLGNKDIALKCFQKAVIYLKSQSEQNMYNSYFREAQKEVLRQIDLLQKAHEVDEVKFVVSEQLQKLLEGETNDAMEEEDPSKL